ncbi:MAG: indolepyruvate ferredoxin oxidoreductase, beta subunit [Bacteroidetes bacterium]|nr:indolepyruvate ferredoxin oxidoreductase, beta subunit [Bacteroidota bacterium]
MNNNSSGKNLLFAGVGGQGILLVSELAARAAIHAGFDAKKTEVHGAAQRGGSVVSHVRFAPKVYSPLSPAGEVDILLALEKLEGLRWAHYVREGGLIVLNDEIRVPARLTDKPVEYPQNIEQFLTGKGYRLVCLDANSVATGLGNHRAANTVLLGAMANQTGIEDDHWKSVMKESLNPKILDLNIRAFEKGRELVRVYHQNAP